MKLALLFTCILAYNTCPAQDTISIYFDNGVASLKSEARQMLDSLAYHNVLEPGRRYSVIGYADIVGGEKANISLSVRRARAVQAYIEGFGVIIDSAYGAGEIVKPEYSEGYPEDRRVDIIAEKRVSLPDIKHLKKGDVFDLENMSFYGGQAVMKPESKPILESLLAIVKQNPRLKIRIEGHVHCSGYSRGYRQQFVTPDGKVVGVSRPDYSTHINDDKELSVARARMVRNYLVANKVDSTRLQYAGLACKEMNLHPENNRRVSIRILEK